MKILYEKNVIVIFVNSSLYKILLQHKINPVRKKNFYLQTKIKKKVLFLVSLNYSSQRRDAITSLKKQARQVFVTNLKQIFVHIVSFTKDKSKNNKLNIKP